MAYRLLGDAGQMDDVLQDAYVKAYRALGGFRGDAGVGTWLYRITYNACMTTCGARGGSISTPSTG